MAETSDIVSSGDKVEWAPIRQLAQECVELYTEKKIFELNEDYYSTRSTRSTDDYAKKCVPNSDEIGSVYLMADNTAPFKPEHLGEEGDFEDKYLIFEFAYDPDEYIEYLYNNKLPVLTSQYLVTYYALENDLPEPCENVEYTTEMFAEEIGTDTLNVNRLIESRRDKVIKFWDEGKAYNEEDVEVAAELYMRILDLNPGGSCRGIMRIAFAGLNNNGNGNSINYWETIGERPADWVNGLVGSTSHFVDRYITNSTESEDGELEDDLGNPWYSSEPFTMSLTSVAWEADTGGSLHAETIEAEEYVPPPIGCCAEYIWPTIGEEGGGSNSFYSDGTLSNYITWADWREIYQKELILTPAKIAEIKENTPVSDIPNNHFPCYLGQHITGDLSTTYDHIASKKSNSARYQRWIKVDDTTYVRIVPMEFNCTHASKKAYLSVPVSIVKVLTPKSYQPAIRKRWYDMIYYTIRNIAGYKHYGTFLSDDGEEEHAEVVLGVTWDKRITDPDSAYITCADEDYKCQCERWKLLKLGGATDADPFVGRQSEFSNYDGTLFTPDEAKVETDYYQNTIALNAAQMWQWDETRYEKYLNNPNKITRDLLFPELYFERLLCRNQDIYFNYIPGGYENKEDEDPICACDVCKNEITLPWDGGGDNEHCPDDSDFFRTHAFTVNVLSAIKDFIVEYKANEDVPRTDCGVAGECHSVATAGEMGIKFTGANGKHIDAVDDCSLLGETDHAYECISHDIDVTFENIPAFYETLSENDEVTPEEQTNSVGVYIPKENKAYGYNAYVWKTVDPGGYSENKKDVTIRIVIANPTPQVGSCAVTNGLDISEEKDPFYMYDDNTYKLKKQDGTDLAISIQPNDIYAPKAVNANHVGDNRTDGTGVWQEILYGLSKDPCTSGDISIITSDISARIPLWCRDNQRTSIGSIDIYLGPHHQHDSIHIGTVTLTRSYDIDEDYLTDSAIMYYCTDTPKSGSLGDNSQQYTADIVWAAMPSYSILNGEVQAEILHQPVMNMMYPEENYMELQITLPAGCFSTVTAKPDDQRQKYIILAMRSSHTYITSWLSTREAGEENQPVEIPAEETGCVAAWAKRNSGACRYAEYQLLTTFSYDEPEA